MRKTTCINCKGSGFVGTDPTPTRGPISGRMLQSVAKECDNCEGAAEVLAVFGKDVA